MNEPTSLGDWKRVADLGSGSFGVVQLWTHHITHENIAIKKCRFAQKNCITPKQRERWTQEVNFMREVNHPNIVAYKKLPDDFHAQLDRYNLSGLPLLAMEYCTGGCLRRVLTQPRHLCGLRELDVRRVLEDIANAVEHLHRQNITHRDIKPENIVLCAGPRVTYKLIDLGYAKDMNALNSFVGTLAYTAPEIFRNERYTHNVDYWSFGIMAYELCCGRYPFMVDVSPVQRFDLLSAKGPRDICVYKTNANRTIYTDKIIEPNYISPCLRTYLEDWLGTMLQFDSAKRGQTQSSANVFSALRSILNKQILHVFVVYNYSHYYYEVNAATKVDLLQNLISKSTLLAVEDQLILTTSTSISKMDFYNRINEPTCKVTDLGLLPQSMLMVLKRGQFINAERVNFPAEVKELLNPGTNHNKPWRQRRMDLSHGVRYIEMETNKMKIVRMVVHEMSELLRLRLEEQAALVPTLLAEGRRALHLVEFCREMNAGCSFDGSKVMAITQAKNQLRKVKELIENANSACTRYVNARTKKSPRTKSSKNQIVSLMNELRFDDFNNEALEFMNVNKEKEDIATLICKCVKTRRALHGKQLTDHVEFCFKVLREYEKLTRWMRALIGHLGMASVELLEAQKRLSNFGATSGDGCSVMGSVVTLNGHADVGHVQRDGSNEEDEDEHNEGVDDLVYVNRMLRSQMMESVNNLLLTHKKHAINIGEFVNFMDNVSITNDVIGNIEDEDMDSHSTAV